MSDTQSRAAEIEAARQEVIAAHERLLNALATDGSSGLFVTGVLAVLEVIEPESGEKALITSPVKVPRWAWVGMLQHAYSLVA